MSRQVRIPVVKNQVKIKKPARRQKPYRKFWLLALGFGTTLLFVHLKVQTNTALAEVQNLEQELNRYRTENEKYQSQVIELSNFARIRDIAKNKLKLDFLTHEKIIEISAP